MEPISGMERWEGLGNGMERACLEMDYLYAIFPPVQWEFYTSVVTKVLTLRVFLSRIVPVRLKSLHFTSPSCQ